MKGREYIDQSLSAVVRKDVSEMKKSCVPTIFLIPLKSRSQQLCSFYFMVLFGEFHVYDIRGVGA